MMIVEPHMIMHLPLSCTVWVWQNRDETRTFSFLLPLNLVGLMVRDGRKNCLMCLGSSLSTSPSFPRNSLVFKLPSDFFKIVISFSNWKERKLKERENGISHPHVIPIHCIDVSPLEQLAIQIVYLCQDCSY